jgi:hypothetical protein
MSLNEYNYYMHRLILQGALRQSFCQNLFKYAVLHIKKGLRITDIARNKLHICKQTSFDTIQFLYFIRHCFICRRPSDQIASEDAGIEPLNVTTLALAVKRYNRPTTVDLICWLDIIHTQVSSL